MTLTHLLAGTILVGTVAAFTVLDASPTITDAVETVIDGDTLKLAGNYRIRLAGIDAPELHQSCGAWPCGSVSKQRMQEMVERDRQVTCQIQTRDRYNRTIAICSNSEGDLGRRLVAQGLALAYRRYSTMYVDEEAAAQREGLGIWAGPFENPEKYRHSRTK